MGPTMELRHGKCLPSVAQDTSLIPGGRMEVMRRAIADFTEFRLGSG